MNVLLDQKWSNIRGYRYEGVADECMPLGPRRGRFCHVGKLRSPRNCWRSELARSVQLVLLPPSSPLALCAVRQENARRCLRDHASAGIATARWQRHGKEAWWILVADLLRRGAYGTSSEWIDVNPEQRQRYTDRRTDRRTIPTRLQVCRHHRELMGGAVHGSP